MNDTQPMSAFENELRAALAPPAMRPEFRQALGRRLRVAAMQQHPRRSIWRPAWRPALAVVLAGLLLAILAIGPQRVLAQVLDWIGGYVPGVGFVETENGLRVLEEPVSQTRDGLTLTVRQGLVDDNGTKLTVLFEGIRPDQLPASEDVIGCFERPYIELPDGSQLATNQGTGGGGPSWQQLELGYEALPPDVNDVTLVAHCVLGTLPGSAPEDWRLDLHFVPAPEDFDVLPALPVPTEAASPEADQAPLGMALTVQQMVALDDGYLFQVRFDWDASGYEYVAAANIDMTLTDANGVSIPIEVDFDRSSASPDEHYTQWNVRTQTQQIASPAVLALPRVSIPVSFSEEEAPVIAVDLGSAPSVGQTWTVDQAFDVLGGSVQLSQVRLASENAGEYLLNLDMLLDSESVLAVAVLDLDNQSPYLLGGGGGGDESHITQSIGYSYLPEGVHRFQLASANAVAQGPWQVTLDLPSAAGGDDSGEGAPAACLTEDGYAALQPAALPNGVGGHLLLQDFAPEALLPDLRIVNPDGSDVQSIDIGAWGGLSPDGRYLAYAREGLHVVDLQSGLNSLLLSSDDAYAMSWSPDGRLAFIRAGLGLYLVNPDGSGLQPVPGSNTDMIGIAGWLPDGQHLVVTTIVPGGTQVQTLDVNSGEVVNNLLVDSATGGAVRLSPDGGRIAFVEPVFGGGSASIYVANLDGTDRHLVTDSTQDIAFDIGAWSPDGEWLVVNALSYADIQWRTPVLVNVESCQVLMLDGIEAEVTDWSPGP